MVEGFTSRCTPSGSVRQDEATAGTGGASFILSVLPSPPARCSTGRTPPGPPPSTQRGPHVTPQSLPVSPQDRNLSRVHEARGGRQMSPCNYHWITPEFLPRSIGPVFPKRPPYTRQNPRNQRDRPAIPEIATVHHILRINIHAGRYS